MKYRWGMIRMLAVAAILAGTMSGCLGCGGGGNVIQMQLDSTHEQPVWVGIYLLSKESALDGRPNSELTNKETARTFGPSDGVLDFDVRPIYPGEPITFVREQYDPAVSFVLVAANFPKPDPCARVKIPVKKGDDLRISLSAVDRCLKIGDER